MALSYLYQLVNIFAGLIMLPLLLGFLSAAEFLQWSLFTVIAGLSLQVESAIQAILVRSIAGACNHGYSRFQLEIENSRRVYSIFSAIVLVAMGLGGGAYLASIFGSASDSSWVSQWFIFVLVYCFNYICGPNNCILIATDKTTQFNLINSASRMLNLSLTSILLINDLGIWGLIFSFSASVSAGCYLNYLQGQKAQANFLSKESPAAEKIDYERPAISNIVKYGAYVFVSYALYRSILLVAAMQSDAVDQNAGLALTLQIFAILSTVAMTPFQMRVAPLVQALIRKDSQAASIEFSKLSIMMNGMFIVCVMLILVVPNTALQSLNPEIRMIDKSTFLLMALGFITEANLQSIAATMLIKKNMKFIRIYLTSILLIAVVSVSIVYGLNGGILSLFVAIIVIQILLTIPAFVAQLRFEMPVGRHSFFLAASQAVTSIFRLLPN
jgi:hypothetical protein